MSNQQKNLIIPVHILNAFSDSNPIRRQYQDSMRVTGCGAYDNAAKQMRFYVLHQLIDKAVRDHPDHDVAECGCWKGHSSHITASILAKHGFRGTFSLFDSFEGGLSEYTDQDFGKFSPNDKSQIEQHRKLFKSTELEVVQSLSEFDFVSIYPGWIPNRFKELSDSTFSFVNIDVDLYQPTKDSIEFFYPRVVDGGIIYFDDYGTENFPGAKRAIDEYLVNKNMTQFLEIPTGSAFLIK